jgi:hypothetical protein
MVAMVRYLPTKVWRPKEGVCDLEGRVKFDTGEKSEHEHSQIL